MNGMWNVLIGVTNNLVLQTSGKGFVGILNLPIIMTGIESTEQELTLNRTLIKVHKTNNIKDDTSCLRNEYWDH